MSEKIGVIIDFLTPAYEKTLRDTAARCGYDIVFFPSSKAAAGNVDDCTILYGHPSQKVIAGAKNLKWYASCWAGIDRFCRDELYQNPDCLLTNASGAYGTTIAEHSVMVSLMLLRRELEYTEVIREGDWRVLPGGIRSLHGARVTCLGTGDIGTEFARRVRAFHPASLIGVSRSGRANEDFDKVYPVTELDQLLPETDLLFMSLPSVSDTVNILDAARMALLPEGAYVAGNMTLGYTCERNVALFCENLENYAAGRPLHHLVDRKKGYCAALHFSKCSLERRNETDNLMKNTQTKNCILRVLQGAIIGAGAILPGISGGVLAVIFGIYRPAMELLTHPKRAFPRYWRMLLAVGIGWVLGFLGGGSAILALFHQSETVATCLFIGLILGTLPELWREAGAQGRRRGAYLSLSVSFLALFAVLMAVRFGSFSELPANFGGFLFCGVLWGFSFIIPGMTSSSILMAVGLLTPMVDGITHLDLSVLLPWTIGMCGVVALFARLVSKLFDAHYPLAYHAVIGVVLASTLAIIPTGFASSGEMIWSAVCAVLGAVLAALGGKIRPQEETSES